MYQKAPISRIPFSQSQLSFDNNLDKKLLTRSYICFALVATAYFFLIYVLSDSLPRKDDLNDVFGFLLYLNNSSDLLEKLISFFYPNSDHTPLINHIIYFLYFKALGAIDFQHLILIGCLFNILVVAIIIQAIKPLPAITFFIASSYFSLCYWDSSLWAMTAISHQATLFFAASAFLFATKKQWLMAVIMGICSHSSQTNGILCWPILASIALLNDRERFKQLATTILLVGACYHIILTKTFSVLAPPEKFYNIMLEMDLNQGKLSLDRYIQSYFLLVGQAWIPFKNPLLAIATGSGLLTIVLVTLLKNLNNNPKNIFIFSFIAFNLLTLLGVTYSRPIHFHEFNFSLYDKYRIYSILVTILIATTYFQYSTLKKWSSYLSLIIGSIIVIYNFSFIKNIKTDSTRTKNSITYWALDGNLSRNQALHFPGSDHFYFTAHKLKFWDMYGSLGIPLLPFTESNQSCEGPNVTSTICPFDITHNRRATTADIKGHHHLAIGSTIQLCIENGNSWTSAPIQQGQLDSAMLWIDRTTLPSGINRFIVRKNQQVICQRELKWPMKRAYIWDHKQNIPWDVMRQSMAK